MEPIDKHPLYKVHTIDSAMNSIWEFYKQKFVALFIISFIMGLILQYLSTLINISELQSITDINEIMLKLRDYMWPMILVSLVTLLFTTILHYYIIYNPLSTENNFFRCLMNSLRYFVPYLIIMIFLAIAGSFALFLGLLVLFVGALFAAIYVMTLYLFILPILMVEGPGIANAISRTVVLAHRNFWSNMGWTAVFIIIILVISIVFSALILLPFTGSFFKAFSDPGEAASLADITTKPVYLILSAVLNAVTMPLLPIFACILYFNGRAREDQQYSPEPVKEDEEKKVRVEDLYAKPNAEDQEE